MRDRFIRNRRASRPAESSSTGLLLRVVAPVALLVTVMTVYAIARGNPVTDPFSDPSDTVGYSRVVGAGVIIGLGLWVASATLALRASTDSRLPTDHRHWLRRLGAATLLLWLDDAYLVHETLGELQPAGEAAAMLGLAGVLLLLLIPSSHVVRRHPDRLVALAAVALLAGSVAVDLLEPFIVETMSVSRRTPSFVEEVLKMLGIAAWLAATMALTRSGEHATSRDHDMRRETPQP